MYIYAHGSDVISLHRSLIMGVLADALRENLRQLAMSDARRLRELDRILKESRAVDDKIKRLT